MPRHLAALLWAVAGLAAALIAAWPPTSGALPDAPTARFPCLSYVPFYRAGMDPRKPGTWATPEEIDADLRQLARVTGCVRTYGMRNGLDAVPAVAKRRGIEVVVGLWLTGDPTWNAGELELLRGVLARDRAAVRAIIAGNETILREELSPADLAAWVDRVRALTDLPVGYADGWHTWVRAPELARHVSFIALNLIPFWEPEPPAIGDALRFTIDRYRDVRRRYPEARIYVSEVGWPSAGQSRGAAVPGPRHQAAYLREVARWAEAERIDYNVIEAYDQPWKRFDEGRAGSSWGVFDARGREKFRLQGAWQADGGGGREGRTAWAAGLVVLTFGAAWAFGARRRPRAHGALSGAAILVAGAAATLGLALALAEIRARSFTALEALPAGGAVLASLALAARAVGQLARTGKAAPIVAWRAAATRGPAARAASALRLACGFGFAAQALLLAFDGRFRDVWPATTSFALGCLGWVALLAPGEAAAGSGSRAGLPRRVGREELALAAVLVLAALGTIAREGLRAPEPVAWFVACLGLGCLLGFGAVAHRDEQAR
ncbi:hypothetical protein [Sorangium sp. So ce341]|uniref:hypothetical protein n=1 Tax=Sorangium sp. So ce341 TaxID=3133302 RepID=UPI003F63F21E